MKRTIKFRKEKKIRVRTRRFKKLSLFQLQNRADSDCWGNWVARAC